MLAKVIRCSVTTAWVDGVVDRRRKSVPLSMELPKLVAPVIRPETEPRSEEHSVIANRQSAPSSM